MNDMTNAFVLAVGPTYRRTLGSVGGWTLMYGYQPLGTEAHLEDGWEYIDGICCEVFRHPNGGVVAQPTKVCEAAASLAHFELPLAA
jgi:hypothetical protein